MNTWHRACFGYGVMTDSSLLKHRNAAPATLSTAPSALALRQRFLSVRARTEALAASLSAEDAQVSVTGDTSPPKWHLAHTTWFFEHMALKAFSPGYEEVDPAYDFLFNSYYETVGTYLPKKRRPQMSRPGLAEVLRYRRAVTERTAELLEGPADSAACAVIELGINHEEQHQELLLMDIKQNFFASPLRPVYASEDSRLPHEARDAASVTKAPSYQAFAGGKHLIGFAGEGFAYDNESGQHAVWLEPYELSSRMVTCGEYLEFIEAGGYQDPRHWLSDGWDFVRSQNVKAPLYWEEKGGERTLFTLAGTRPLNLSEPVSHVSYYEAQAYAAWRGARLPTEFEWEAAVTPLAPAAGHFLEDREYHPRPAAAGEGLAQAHGTLWEWTGSAYLPYPRYRPYDSSLAEYNGKFMCNQMVLRGGSLATPRAHYRTTYRNFFYPQMRWQFSGFRLARSLPC